MSTVVRDLKTVLTELQALQTEYAGKAMPEDVGKKFDALAVEANEMQKATDREKELKKIERWSHEIPDPTLPDTGKQKQGEVAGYIGLGDYVLASAEYAKYAASNFRGEKAVIQIDGATLMGKNALTGPRGQPMIPLSREQKQAYEGFLETKLPTVPTLGDGVVSVERLVRIPQVTQDDVLTMRDVIATGQTGAGSVEYVRLESHTQAAAEVAHGAAKPDETLNTTLQTATVRTIAAWMPVQNQQLEDMPQLRSLIENRLRYSLKRREEYQILWGDGVAPNLEGLFTVAGTTDIALDGRYLVATDTLIDVIRRGITDVRVSGYEPNFVVAHPYDWEEIVLLKGTDNRYVWAVVTDASGTRIWGLRVIETVAAQARTAYATDERRLLVGDGNMGAQILDRMQMTVIIGLIDDQLIKNMKTVLVEERLALPIYAPSAFAHFKTQSAAT